MSKKAFKTQASSSRAAAAAGNALLGSGSGFSSKPSVLSYVYEPPDLSGISDPTVIVSFKNLQKKDSTTKFKALEDLHNNLEVTSPAFLEAWTKLFPRTSIDNSNRVRQSSYALHGKIVSLCGKTFVPYMPSTVGPWLAGGFDRDRQVSRIARESVASTFATEEKRRGVWKAFQEPILSYALEAIQQETVQTLSDERTSSPDDAQAKYARAISGALNTLTGLLDILSTEELHKHSSSYQECLQSDAIWELTSSKDSALRRGAYRLASYATTKLPEMVDVSKLGSLLIKRLSTDQAASAYEFVQALNQLTKMNPQIWNAADTLSAKKSPTSRLISFLGKGSFGTGPEYYKELSVLLKEIPIETLLADTVQSEPAPSKVLSSLRDGITNELASRRETQSQTNEPWQCLLSLSDRIISSVVDSKTKDLIVGDTLLPIIKHYVDPALVEWGRNWPEQEDVVQLAFSIAWKYCPGSTSVGLEEISKALIESMQISLPEQSKDYKKSQDYIIAIFSRWYDLQSSLLRNHSELITVLSETAVTEVEAATELLKSRNSKPYGAATVLELLVTKVPETSLEQAQVYADLQKFAAENVPRSMQSASASAYLKLLDVLGSKKDTRDVLDAAVVELLAAPRSPARSKALQSLALSHWPSSSENSKRFVQAILDDLDEALKQGSGTWSLPFVALNSKDAPLDLDDQILSTMLEGLSVEAEIEPSLQGFQQLAGQNNASLRKFASSSSGSELLSRLLYLSHEGPESLQQQTDVLRDAIGAMAGGDANPIASIIRSNILNTGSTALPISTLWLQAEDYLKSIPAEQLASVALKLLPDINIWRQRLQPFLEQNPDPSISVTDSLGGAVHLVSQNPANTKNVSSEYDTQALAAPLRAASFSAKLLQKVGKLEPPKENIGQIYGLIAIVTLLLSDNLGLNSERPIFATADYDETEITAVLDELQTFLTSWISNSVQSDDTSVLEALQYLLENAKGLTSSAYYHARAYIASTQRFDNAQRIPAELKPDELLLNRSRKSLVLFTDLAKLTTSSDPKANLKLFNELVSDLTAAKDCQSDTFMTQIVTLMALIKNTTIDIEGTPRQRFVFFVKALIEHLPSPIDKTVRAEIFKALAVIIQVLPDIYGEFWDVIVQQAVSAMDNLDAQDLYLVHATLQLYRVLELLQESDSNEDLQEAWTKYESEIVQSRLKFLENQANSSVSTSQPLRIVYDLLYRQLEHVPQDIQILTEGLFSVMQSDSTILHRTVYRIADERIIAAQEQVSLDAALTQDYMPKLPHELLLLLNQMPHEEDTVELRTRSELPASLSRYLFGWELILAHWSCASYKVQAAYVNILKESSTIVDNFLTLCFTALIEQHGGRNKVGFDPTRLPSIKAYHIKNSEDPQTDYLWLLCNIYYRLLLHAPHLVKAWHTNSCPRALKAHVETWTSRHMSSLVIAEELEVVSEWKPPSDDPKSELTIKISPKAAEVTASLPLDETFISIKVHLPSSYPLAAVDISTVQRMGIDEKKWQSYLNVARIMMNFSSTSQGLGAVIDGISSWRNNVVGALKGHNECAICYSVVGEDGKVPTKRCGTCSNLFHGLCLYKWFSRSASSTCPLCRNSFTYN